MSQAVSFERYRRLLRAREQDLKTAGEGIFDVAIVGGGISGAAAFHYLSAAGYRVLLLEKEDFAAGSSQGSAMMIWGGLLYLCSGHVGTVLKLLSCREEMVKTCPMTAVRTFLYLSLREGGHPLWAARLVLQLYWLLGGARGRGPRRHTLRRETGWLRTELFRAPIAYREAAVFPSDARLVLARVLTARSPSAQAFNHCEVLGVEPLSPDRRWTVRIRDRLVDREHRVQARWVVNAAGVWADELQSGAGVESPYRHLPAKGVFIGFDRLPGNDTPLIVDTGNTDTRLSLIPWGPVSLWGPTETVAPAGGAGFKVESEDVLFLLREWNRYSRRPFSAGDIVCLRCGVRPLPLRAGATPPRKTMRLARRYALHLAPERNWLAIYGGKLTGSPELGHRIARMLKRYLSPSESARLPRSLPSSPEYRFGGEAFASPSPHWCLEREQCWTLEDYVRRRTNIAQWVARQGLGHGDRYLGVLEELAVHFGTSAADARRQVEDYRERVEFEFDRLLERVCEEMSHEERRLHFEAAVPDQEPVGRPVLRGV
jgi:glycerol-3-phosphate dehydrogenase